MLPAISNQEHPGTDGLGHVKHRKHVPRAELACLIDN